MAYRDTDYQNQSPGQWAPNPDLASGASAVGAVLTGNVAPTVQQPITAAPYGGNTGLAFPNPVPTVSTFDRVKLLQQRLNDLGAGLRVDGIMGPKTQAAMARYGLDVNGNQIDPTASAGVSSPVPATPTPAAPAPQDIETQVRTTYGYLGTILLDNPEIHQVLLDAVNNGWSPAEVQGALMNTNYWKTTQASVRNWDTLEGTDPASATAQVQQRATAIGQEAAKLGVGIDPGRLNQIATDSLRLGWDATQIQQAIGNEFHYAAGTEKGDLAVAAGQIRKMAFDYMVPMSDQTLSGYEQSIARGQATADSFRQDLVNLAKSTYQAPWIQNGLDGGMTMQQLADPYRQIAAKDLEIDPQSIDFSQPQWSKALNYVDPNGNRTGMSLADWQTEIRSNPVYGFQHTQTARDMAYDMVLGIEKDLGKVA